MLLQHVDLASLQTDKLGILVWNDLENDLIEIRERLSLRVFLPILRIAIEDESLAWVVAGELKRANRHEVRGRSGGEPRFGERSSVERGL